MKWTNRMQLWECVATIWRPKWWKSSGCLTWTAWRSWPSGVSGFACQRRRLWRSKFRSTSRTTTEKLMPKMPSCKCSTVTSTRLRSSTRWLFVTTSSISTISSLSKSRAWEAFMRSSNGTSAFWSQNTIWKSKTLQELTTLRPKSSARWLRLLRRKRRPS